MAENGWKWLEMAGDDQNGWNWLDITGMDQNGWKWLEKARTAGNASNNNNCLDMAGMV